MQHGPNQPPRPGRNRRRRRGGRPGQVGHHRQAAFTGPMDHSYRNPQGPGGNHRFRGGYQPQRFHQEPAVEPLAISADAPTRIVAAIDDLFFIAKVQETARKLNVKVDFVKSDKELLERVQSNGAEQPSLIIFDLNSVTAKPLTTIPKLKSKLKGTSIIGFLSHVQGDLKQKAQQAGCDAVMPRSAFSQNLPQLLRRHGAPEEQSFD